MKALHGPFIQIGTHGGLRATNPSTPLQGCLGALAGQRWRLDAACQNEDPGLFHTDGAGEHAKNAAAKAKKVCAGCPVRAQCLADAHETRDEHGVRGGLTAKERRAGRERPVAACGTRAGYRRHRGVLKEDACADCKKANSTYTVATDKRWPKTRTA